MIKNTTKQAKDAQFIIDNVRVLFSDIDKIAWEKIEREYEQEDIDSDDEIMQG